VVTGVTTDFISELIKRTLTRRGGSPARQG
jgi:hypothetical protein